MAALAGTHEVPPVWLQVQVRAGRAHVQGCCRLPVSGEVLEKRCPGNTPQSLPVPAECENMEQAEPDTFARAVGAPPTPGE